MKWEQPRFDNQSNPSFHFRHSAWNSLTGWTSLYPKLQPTYSSWLIELQWGSNSCDRTLKFLKMQWMTNNNIIWNKQAAKNGSTTCSIWIFCWEKPMNDKNLPGVECPGKYWIYPSLGFSADKMRRETRNEQQWMELWFPGLVVILFVVVFLPLFSSW